MEDNLNLFCKWKTTSIYFVNGRQPQFFSGGDVGGVDLESYSSMASRRVR
jgi:hypothetical protein